MNSAIPQWFAWHGNCNLPLTSSGRVPGLSTKESINAYLIFVLVNRKEKGVEKREGLPAERRRKLASEVVFEKATEALKADHRVIEKVLAVLEKLTADPQALDAWNKAIDFIRNFADRCHHLKEEKIFFPALEKKGIPRDGGPIGMMLTEHEEGRGYVRAMAEALKGEVPPKTALVENARAYLSLLRDHIRKEDEILFNMADEVLSSEEQKNLLREFEEHEAKEVGAGIHAKYLRIAQELAAACR